jgi:hypothetical protein
LGDAIIVVVDDSNACALAQLIMRIANAMIAAAACLRVADKPVLIFQLRENARQLDATTRRKL